MKRIIIFQKNGSGFLNNQSHLPKKQKKSQKINLNLQKKNQVHLWQKRLNRLKLLALNKLILRTKLKKKISIIGYQFKRQMLRNELIKLLILHEFESNIGLFKLIYFI